MPKVNTHLLYSLIFSVLLGTGVLIYSSQSRPQVLSEDDFSGFGSDDTPIPTTTGIEPIVTPTPTSSPSNVVELKNLYLQKYNDASAKYISADSIGQAPARVNQDDFIKLNKTLLLTQARYRLMISNTFQLIENIEIANETNQLYYRDTTTVRALVKNSRDKLAIISGTVDGLDNAINGLSSASNLNNALSDITNMTSQIENSLSGIATDLQYIIPPTQQNGTQ